MEFKFDDVFSIMKVSFPPEEMRNYEGQKELLNRDDYFIETYTYKGTLAGFCAYYIFNDLIYIEHLACLPEFRGLGIGTKLVQKLLNQFKEKVFILEVEPPIDTVTGNRIRFYQKLGFHLNPYYHFQHSLNEGMGGVELKIMSSVSLTEEKQKQFRKILNIKVYQVDENLSI